MNTLVRLLAQLNRIPIGRRSVRLGSDRLFPDSLDRYLASLAWRLGWLEGRERRWIEATLHSGMVAVDVGANIGVYTLALARCVGATGRVYALEPEPRNFRALSRAVEAAGLTQVELRQAAAGDAPGTAALSVSPANRGDHRLFASGSDRAVLEVPVLVLDELLRRESRIDFIKIDVQGTEPAVLRGLRATLERNPGLRVLCELCPALLRRAGATRDEFFAPLADAGLAPHRIATRSALQILEADAAWELAVRAGFVNLVWQRPA
ncbi:MAG: FkbM family methyltransferase [Deltaproteobacteria bacterium]|nr:MAG: FkbM family methyltransferase [Deltaproteobacteria bacterium]